MQDIIIAFIAGMITSSIFIIYLISASIGKAINDIDKE
jgi:hypothetical protein